MGSDYLTLRRVSLSGNAAIVEAAALSGGGGGGVAACGGNRSTNNHVISLQWRWLSVDVSDIAAHSRGVVGF